MTTPTALPLRLREVPLSSLRLEAKNWINPRTMTGLGQDDIAEMADSIKANGILDNPKVCQVKEGEIVFDLVIDGQRRVLGGREALPKNAMIRVVDLEPKPVELTEEKADELMIKALTIGNKRAGLSAYELCEVAYRMRARGHKTLNDIADALHRSEGWVSKILKARGTATPQLLHLWRKGDITEEQFRDMAVIDGDKQKEAATGVVEARRAGNVAEARTRAKESSETAKAEKKKAAPPKAEKPAKAKGAAPKPNGHAKTDDAKQGTMAWEPPPAAAPKTEKRAAPPRSLLEETVALAVQRAPVHDYVKGIMDGLRFATGELTMAELAKPWLQYVSRLGGTVTKKASAKKPRKLGGKARRSKNLPKPGKAKSRKATKRR